MYKEFEFEPQLLSKCVLAALFAGILATLADEAYNLFYRLITGFVPSEIINVSSLLFGTLLFFMVAGIIWYFLSLFIKRSAVIFAVLFLVITSIGFMVAMQTHRSVDPRVTSQFRGLFTGIVLIMGLMAAFLIPYFTKRHKLFL